MKEVEKLEREYYLKYGRFPNTLEINSKDLSNIKSSSLIYNRVPLNKIKTICGLKIILSEDYDKPKVRYIRKFNKSYLESYLFEME